MIFSTPLPDPMEQKITNQRVIYKGFLSILQYTFRHQQFLGTMSPVLERECVVPGNTVAVLPYDPKRKSVILIQQFRVATVTDARSPWLTEIVAGFVGQEDTTEAAARRETEEETGCSVKRLLYLMRYFPTPGYSSEQQTLYLAEVDSESAGGVHGLNEEGEDILSQVVDCQTAYALMENGTIEHAPALLALQWLQRNESRLDSVWSL